MEKEYPDPDDECGHSDQKGMAAFTFQNWTRQTLWIKINV